MFSTFHRLAVQCRRIPAGFVLTTTSSAVKRRTLLQSPARSFGSTAFRGGRRAARLATTASAIGVAFLAFGAVAMSRTATTAQAQDGSAKRDEPRQPPPSEPRSSLLEQASQYLAPVRAMFDELVGDAKEDLQKNEAPIAILPPLEHSLVKYTLLINLDVLAQRTHDRRLGNTVVKRLGVDYALGELARFYDIVIYTKFPQEEAQRIIDIVDAGALAHYRIFKNTPGPASRFVVYQDDTSDRVPAKFMPLHLLGRDVEKVIILDDKLPVAPEHRNNVVVLEPWNERNSPDLLDATFFLAQAAANNRNIPELIGALHDSGQSIADVFRTLRLERDADEAKAYRSLIMKLPEVEQAEATAPSELAPREYDESQSTLRAQRLQAPLNRAAKKY